MFLLRSAHSGFAYANVHVLGWRKCIFGKQTYTLGYPFVLLVRDFFLYRRSALEYEPSSARFVRGLQPLKGTTKTTYNLVQFERAKLWQIT